MSDFNISNNEKRSRFELELNDELARMDYLLQDNVITLTHTFAPESMRGKGASSALAKFALDYIKEKKFKLIVECPFVAAYIKKHPDYESAIDVSYRGDY